LAAAGAATGGGGEGVWSGMHPGGEGLGMARVMCLRGGCPRVEALSGGRLEGIRMMTMMGGEVEVEGGLGEGVVGAGVGGMTTGSGGSRCEGVLGSLSPKV
jgi:hypothetical protein